ALYPDTERTAILIVAQHPEILVRMEQIRRNTEDQFKKLLDGLSEEDQKKLYNVARYPELVREIVSHGERLSNDEMDKVLVKYDADVHDDATFANRKYFSLLQYMADLNHNAEVAFDDILVSYPTEVHDAAHRLVKLPSVLSVLSDNMNLTVLLGDLYTRQPVRIMHELDSLNVVLAEKQSKEVEDWKQELESNPDAMTEFESAASEFAGNEGYDDDVYDGPMTDRYREDVYVHHVWRPYPFWFGWPSWYDYECWYPYPWWYHWGYYYGPHRMIVIISLPSNVFLDWHFRHYGHFYHYPHFTDRVIDHYYGPRSYGAHVQPVLRRFEEEHRGELPANWWNDDKNRVDRIREFGKFKTDYEDLV
ncbi:MAG TPA: hypothetical protein VJ508_19365, partial [Saprospiraceae bacterium]|nr:hypothetical protein [Saprospiraceae bacterium]